MWKKTESNVLINPNECIMGEQELGERERPGVEWGLLEGGVVSC